MFRRLEDSLTADSVYPEDLKELGYLITPEHKIRQIKDPKQKFKFRVTNNERHNEMRGEAMNNILREEVMNRMKDLGYVLVNVPPFTIEKPEFPHLPILSTHPDELKAKKRVIIIVGDEQEDLGIWSWRDMLGSSDDSEQEGIEFGSCINFARELKKRAADDEQADGPGLIILNPGQLAFSWKKQKAMTLKSWNHLPRESLSHPSVYLHTDWNLIEGHTTSTEHVQSTFHALLSEPKRLHNDVELYFIGIGSGCGSLLLSIEKYCE